MHNSAAKEAGFTLLELLVSLALLGLITTYLFSSFGFGRRVWQVSASVAETASVDIARDYLRRRLTQAEYLLRPDTRAGEIAVFEGRPNSLQFVADTSDRLRTGGLYQVSVTLDEASGTDQDGAVLLVSESLFQGATFQPAGQDAAHTTELLQGLQSLEMSYYGNPTFNNQADRWYDEWVKAARLPKLVAIKVAFKRQAADRRSWPDFLVELKLADTR